LGRAGPAAAAARDSPVRDAAPIPQWDAELDEEAELAIVGEHCQTGAKLAQGLVRVE
jgi:hypothetical protein